MNHFQALIKQYVEEALTEFLGVNLDEAKAKVQSRTVDPDTGTVHTVYEPEDVPRSKRIRNIRGGNKGYGRNGATLGNKSATQTRPVKR